MEQTSTIAETRQAVRAARARGASVGFVPTMGALHEGHLSLVRRAKEETGFVAVSVFVNPTQFGPGEDFDKYPRDLERDAALAEGAGADLLFAPSVAEMYPHEPATAVSAGGPAGRLEGERRPGHFDGVCLVCCKLFNIVLPDAAFFGRKDYQQCLVVRRMAHDLNMPLEIRVCPTVREPDGLAMSSRNRYLSPEERRQATCLYRALQSAREAAEGGERDAEALRQQMRRVIGAEPLAEIDYVSVAAPDSLAELKAVQGEAVALLAVRFGGTRLIDNEAIRAG